jgi:hypothetical protein
VLGVLALIALLALTFSKITTTERSVSRNYLDLVRARIIAESGVDHSLALLQSIAKDPFMEGSPGARAWVYYGKELDETQSPQPDVPVEVARNPSFAWEDEPVQDPANAATLPKQISIHGTPCGFSGTVGGSYSPNGDQFVLKVSDLSGRIHVNDGVAHYGGKVGSVSKNVARILNRLGDVISCPGLGDTIIGQRPPGGYLSTLELERVLGPAVYRKASKFLTTHAWVDPNVCLPVPLSAAHLADYPVSYYRGTPPVYRSGRGLNALGAQVPGQLLTFPPPANSPFAHGVYAMDELNPQWIEVVGRAPVNVNSARREVLLALLADLQGFFISYRRRNNIEPRTVGMYWFPLIIHNHSPEGQGGYINVPSEGDEYGFLYKTVPFKLKGGTLVPSNDKIDAELVADQIIACRERAGVYSGLGFGGPFKTWRQFNAFCDYLVQSGILEDKRPIFFDYQPTGPQVIKPGNITGYGPLIVSNYQRAVASRALADVLKANFNPNLHLNELNPDSNLFLHVDKTDLIVQSTEFSFTPTGYFQVESLGRVLQAAPSAELDVLTAPDNRIISEQKIVATVRLFDIRRETHQKQFAAGALSPRDSLLLTNSNASLEIGPEPDNGPGPLENEWGGYVALPTIGGLGVAKPAGAVAATPQKPSETGETIRVHFQRDFDASHHQDNIRQELAQTVQSGEHVSNFPDPGETQGGPYDPAHGPAGRHRLARSFRLPPPGSPTQVLPSLFRYAPLDLRVDGGYSERHASPAWWISPQSFAPNCRDISVVVSFWIKPSFPPERSGKPRMLVAASRWTGSWMTRGGMQLTQEAHFALFYNAGHEALPGEASAAEDMSIYGELNSGNPGALYFGFLPFRPQAFIFGRGYGQTVQPGSPYYWACCHTGSVNHEGHPHTVKSLFKAHSWTHVTLIAKPRPAGYKQAFGQWFPSLPPTHHDILVNGVPVPGSLESYLNYNGQGDSLVDWTVHQNGNRNSIRFGAPSRFCSAWFPPHDNFSTDATVDEFYLWNSSGAQAQGHAQAQWHRGRYYKPLSKSGPLETREGVFVSPEIELSSTRRVLPPPSAVTPPATETAVTPPLPLDELDGEILGMSWTCFGEDASALQPVVSDARNDQPLSAAVKLYLKKMGQVLGPFTADGYSAIQLKVERGQKFRYIAEFAIPQAEPLSILLTTPVLDDVSIYYRPAGGPRIVNWICARSAAEERP